MKKSILSFIFLLLVIQCQAEIITVDDDGPADFNNIQAAISESYSGDVIEVQPGIYTGLGNRNIDYGGKAITVRSTNGPDDCIIDCASDPNNFYRGFYFHTNEGANSVLDGFKITGIEFRLFLTILSTGSSACEIYTVVRCFNTITFWMPHNSQSKFAIVAITTSSISA